MRKCGSCFRYCENWRDAYEKGLDSIVLGLGDYHQKPRPGVKPHAIGFHCPDDDTIRPDHPACKAHIYRWVWNLHTWWQWHFKQTIIEWFRKYIRVPIGRVRKPVPLEWKDSFDGMADRVVPNGEPVCPHCGEMPYSYERCAFCGQRFLPATSTPDRTAPQRDMRDGEPVMFLDGICPQCGYSCGNGGYGPLRCRCGWVGEELSEEAKRDIDELFAEEFGDSEGG